MDAVDDVVPASPMKRRGGRGRQKGGDPHG